MSFLSFFPPLPSLQKSKVHPAHPSGVTQKTKRNKKRQKPPQFNPSQPMCHTSSGGPWSLCACHQRKRYVREYACTTDKREKQGTTRQYTKQDQAGIMAYYMRILNHTTTRVCVVCVLQVLAACPQGGGGGVTPCLFPVADPPQSSCYLRVTISTASRITPRLPGTGVTKPQTRVI